MGIVFNSNELIRATIKEYAMEIKENIFLNKNDGKIMVFKCMDGCKFYTRFSKRVGNQYCQVVSLIDDHTFHKTPNNRQGKPEWLAKKFAHILRHNPQIKPLRLIAELNVVLNCQLTKHI